ncbi:MAG: DUF7282 domain-containing protein [Halanaeroarchaeum sp.]
MTGNTTDETESRTVPRRAVLKSVAAGGVVAATAGTVSAQEDDEFEETYELIGETAGWEGVAPDDIEGETNPSLDVIPGEQYRVIWENGDGVGHNFSIVGGHGQTVQSSELMSTEGDTQEVTFTAEEDYQEYYCEPHPEAMRGSFRIVSDDDGEGGDGGSYVLSVTVENEDEDPVAATVTVDGDEEEAAEDEGTVSFALPDGDYTVEVDPDGYYPVATEDVTIDGEPVDVTITVGTESGAYVDLGDQTSNGLSVTVNSVTLPEGGFVSIQDPTNFTNYDDGSDDDDPFNRSIDSFFRRTIIGTSEYLESGTHEDVEVELDTEFEGEMRLLAMAHEDTGDTESFDYVDSLGEEDAGYTFAGPNPVARGATMEYTEPEPASFSYDASAPEEVDAGESLLVEVTVTNEGEDSGDASMEATFDNQSVSSTLTVEGGESESDAFEFATNGLGGEDVDWTITADDEEVASGTVSVASTPTEEPTETESPGFGAVAGVAGVGAGAAAAARHLTGTDEAADDAGTNDDAKIEDDAE